MDFRKHLKSRLNQLDENEALNISKTTSEGQGVRKVKFNSQTARSLIEVPFHKKIVFNPVKGLKGLDNFFRLQNYDKKKIDNINQLIMKKKIFSPRKDREVIPGPVLENPQALYFYGVLKYYEYIILQWRWEFTGYIFAKGKDNKFYNVYYYDQDKWYQNIYYTNIPDPSGEYKVLIKDGFIHLTYYYSSDKREQVDISLNVDLINNKNPINLHASGLNVFNFNREWFCKQLEGPIPNKVYCGNEVGDEVYKNCLERGIEP